MKKYLFVAVILLLVSNRVQSQPTQDTSSEGITWYTMKEAQHLAEENGKKVFIYAMAEWCGYCKKVENEVYPDSMVIGTLEKYYYPVELNIESDKVITFNGQTMTEKQFAYKYRIGSTPTFFFLTGKGEILGAQPGYIPSDTFNSLLAYVGTDAFKSKKFEEYLELKEQETGGN